MRRVMRRIHRRCVYECWTVWRERMHEAALREANLEAERQKAMRDKELAAKLEMERQGAS